MLSLLQRTLQLRAGEWRLIAAMGSLLMVNSFAIQVSYVASVSGLLDAGQVAGLPTVWLVSYLLTLGLTSVQMRLIDRYGKRQLLVAVSLLFALLLFTVWWLLGTQVPSAVSYGILYVIADQQWLFFPLVFWAMCTDTFTVAQAKRLLPIIASVGFIGKLLGLVLPWSAPLLPGTLKLLLPQLLLLGSALYVMAAILSLRLSEGQQPKPKAARAVAQTGPGGTAPPTGHVRRRWLPAQWSFSAWPRARSSKLTGAPGWLRRGGVRPPSPQPAAPAAPLAPGSSRHPGQGKGLDASAQRAAVPSAGDAFSIGWQFIHDVPIFKYLALSVLVLAACETILEFVFLFRLERAFSRVEQYERFYSGYRFLTTLLGFMIQTFVTSRLIERLTLRNALSITAVTLSGVSAVMLLLPGFASSWLGLGTIRVIRDTIDESSQKALHAMIPSSKRGRVSLLIDSYTLSLGTVIGCLLLIAVWRVSSARTDNFKLTLLMTLALLLAGTGVWSILRMREVYDSSLLNWRLRRRQRGGDVFERLDF